MPIGENGGQKKTVSYWVTRLIAVAAPALITGYFSYKKAALESKAQTDSAYAILSSSYNTFLQQELKNAQDIAAIQARQQLLTELYSKSSHQTLDLGTIEVRSPIQKPSATVIGTHGGGSLAAVGSAGPVSPTPSLSPPPKSTDAGTKQSMAEGLQSLLGSSTPALAGAAAPAPQAAPDAKPPMLPTSFDEALKKFSKKP